MSAHYWVAQYVTDLFRNEPRNVGVFVETDGQVAAKFLGESETGQIDGRKLHKFRYPEVYKQWVSFWRHEIGHTALPEVAKQSGSHFRVVQAGQVDDIVNDAVGDLASYLYSLLVSEGGFAEALGVDVTEQAVAGLLHDVAETLSERGLLVEGNGVPFPVRRNFPVTGSLNVQHKPAFVQEHNSLVVIETVDFTVPKKRLARDHAGWTAYMFSDIKEARPETESITVVRLTEEDRESDDVSNGLALLNNEGRIVNWLEANQRAQFLDERRAFAFAQ